jgi:uncharacterized protein (DUF2132 family)
MVLGPEGIDLLPFDSIITIIPASLLMNALSASSSLKYLNSSPVARISADCLHCEHWDRVRELDNGAYGQCEDPLTPCHLTHNTHCCCDFKPSPEEK